MPKQPKISKALRDALAAWAVADKPEAEVVRLLGNGGCLERTVSSDEGRKIIEAARAARGLPSNASLQAQARIERGLPAEERHP